MLSAANVVGHHPEQIESLYKQFHHRLKQFIFNRINNKEIAEDLLQDVFVKIHDRIDTLKDNAKLESWVYRIARNSIVDYYRSKKVKLDFQEIDLREDENEDNDVTKRFLPAVREMVEQLPEPYREALTLVEFEGLSQRDLAKRLGLSFSGAKSRVQRARAMVKDLLLQCCHFEFDRYGTIIDYHPISYSCCANKEQQH